MLSVFQRQAAATYFHEYEARLEAANAWRLLAFRSPHENAQETRRQWRAVHDAVRQILAARYRRRFRALEQSVRSKSCQSEGPTADSRRFPHDNQRHIRLGVRG